MQEMNQDCPLLAICIPTYNRCEMLVECLEDTIGKVRKYNLPIVVADNASSDNTRNEVERLRKQYRHLIYIRQPENLGADRNFESCLKQSPAIYSWLLGDSYRIVEQELDNIMALLGAEKYCVLINNSLNRIEEPLPSAEYSDPDRLLYDLGWHMTIMCSLIFHSKLIREADFVRYYNTNFIQNGILFEYIVSHKEALVYWYNRNCNEVSARPKSNSWLNKRWEVFGICWAGYILSLPNVISLSTKKKCILEHNQHMRLFTFTKTCRLRVAGHFNREVLRQSKAYLPFFWDVPYVVPYLIAIAPKWLLRIV